MNFFDLVNISEKSIEIINPSSERKILRAGEMAGMQNGRRVIDFGSGYASALVLWANAFGISGVGIDIREAACERARRKIALSNLTDRLEIVCGKGSEYKFESGSFHVAAAIGTSFIWGDYKSTIHAMREALTPDGKMIVGEPYWKTDLIPPGYGIGAKVSTLKELLSISREEGFDIEFMIPAGDEDWDNYETQNWAGLLRWIEENPNHPERQEVIDFLHKSQDDYLTYQRRYLDWAIFILNPVKY